MSDAGTWKYFKRIVQKYNHYEKGPETDEDRSCKECGRKGFSYPYNCTDGWLNQSKGKDCINWTNDARCVVD